MAHGKVSHYLGYLIFLSGCFIGSTLLSTKIRDYMFATFDNRYATILFILLYFALGIAFSVERIIELITSKSGCQFNRRRFLCLSVPCILFIGYTILTFFRLIPSIPLIAFSLNVNVVSFFLGYTLFTNLHIPQKAGDISGVHPAATNMR